MEFKRVFVLAIIFVIISSFIIISSKNIFLTDLRGGKNYIRLNVSEPFYVKTLVELNPDIEAISYREGNTTIGYVNVLGGIGENFIVEDREYEIIMKENVSLILPY